MLDLGTSFAASVERDPEGLAIVDGAVRLTAPIVTPPQKKLLILGRAMRSICMPNRPLS